MSPYAPSIATCVPPCRSIKDTIAASPQNKLARKKLPELKAKMIEYTLEHAEDIGEGLHVLPGVVSLLDALSSKDIATDALSSKDIATGLMFIETKDEGWSR